MSSAPLAQNEYMLVKRSWRDESDESKINVDVALLFCGCGVFFGTEFVVVGLFNSNPLSKIGVRVKKSRL